MCEAAPPIGEAFVKSSNAAADWFLEHLGEARR